MSFSRITFKEIKNYCSQIDKISICMMETLDYENYENIRKVPTTYDNYYLYGIGMIKSEFNGEYDVSCLEIMLSKKPKEL